LRDWGGSIVTHDIPSNTVAVGTPCLVICSIEEYYEKRKTRALAEAVEYVNSIKERYGREPRPDEMREEFVYFVGKDNADLYERMGVPVRSQLREAYEDYMKYHKPMFDDFTAFLRYCSEQNKYNHDSPNINNSSHI